MKMLTKEILERLPKLYANEDKKPEDVKVIVKFFDPTGSWSWYATEGQPVIEDGKEVDFEFFGYVRGFDNELVYFTLNQLLHAKDNVRGLQSLPIERDMHFGEHTLAEVMEKDL